MIIAVIQARMSSTRLPGKVMKKVLGKPLLWYLTERLKKSKRINKIVIATTVNKADDKISAFAKSNNLDYFRGDEKDVLDRYYSASLKYKPDYIFRITADCPLIDPRHCDWLVGKVISENADYGCLGQTFAEGADCEVFTLDALKESQQNASTQAEREHATLYIHNNSIRYKRVILENSRDDSRYRFTVDELVDFRVVKEILSHFLKINKQNFSYEELINHLKINPRVSRINQNVVRNEGYLNSLPQNEDLSGKKYILFRVDGSNVIGWGHIMRCIGIAEEFTKINYQPIFIIRIKDKNVIKKMHTSGFKLEIIPNNINFLNEAEKIIKIARKYGAKTLVIDLSNKFTLQKINQFPQYIKLLKREIHNITLIDGFNKECITSKVDLPIDIAVIPYVDAENRHYFRQNKAKYLLGPRYAVIRNEFLHFFIKEKKIPKQAHNIIVLPGGSINKLFISKVEYAVKILKSKDLHIKFLRKSQSPAKLYQWADFAISASGLTMYELAFMGVPALIISHNKMHEVITDGFLQKGSIIHLGSKHTVTPEAISSEINKLLINKQKREKMFFNGRELVDGKGAKRIVASIIMKEML